MQVNTTNLEGALELLAQYLGIPLDELRGYAAADPHAKMGWDNNHGGEAPIGSLWPVEGIVLYTLVRALQPSHVIELGTSAGASTTHIAAALVATGKGHAVSVDNKLQLSPGFEAGQLIPPGLRGAVKLVASDGHIFLDNATQADFIMEDMLHSPQSVERVWTRAIELLPPGGMIVSHDAGHFIIGGDVRSGIEAALRKAGLPVDALVMVITPGDCGLAVWRKPQSAFYQDGGENQIAEPKQEKAWQTTEKPSNVPDAKSEAPRRRSSGSKSRRA